MMESNQLFYRRRAFQERVAAVASEDNRAALAHLVLADLYDEQLHRSSSEEDDCTALRCQSVGLR